MTCLFRLQEESHHPALANLLPSISFKFLPHPRKFNGMNNEKEERSKGLLCMYAVLTHLCTYLLHRPVCPSESEYKNPKLADSLTFPRPPTQCFSSCNAARKPKNANAGQLKKEEQTVKSKPRKTCLLVYAPNATHPNSKSCPTNVRFQYVYGSRPMNANQC